MIGIHTVTIDSDEPYELAEWWHEVLGWPFDDETDEDDDEIMLVGPNEPHLLFIRVPEGKSVKNRLHLDLRPQGDGTRDDEVRRLIGLGATVHEDHRYSDGTGWVTMLDLEGNEFCVCRGQAEREAMGD
ncbi:VOC family protein [Sphaerisporangium sp. NPDC051011]|uniref:VOC family protein n=1 Tax=Sphaerisporangium sp. NPDC051011 TaxID=3155792 RepID=UPI0033E23C9B